MTSLDGDPPDPLLPATALPPRPSNRELLPSIVFVSTVVLFGVFAAGLVLFVRPTIEHMIRFDESLSGVTETLAVAAFERGDCVLGEQLHARVEEPGLWSLSSRWRCHGSAGSLEADRIRSIECPRPGEDDIESVTPLYRVKPEYPREAVLAGEEGRVLIEYELGPDGSVHRATVVVSEGGSTEGEVFETPALHAVEKWIYCINDPTDPSVGEPRRIALPFRLGEEP